MRRINFSPFLRRANESPGTSPFVLVILNQPLTSPHFEHLRATCAYCICADGGLSRVMDYAKGHNLAPSALLPDLLVGDLDSVRPEDLAAAVEHRVEITKMPSQDHNDFQKCIQALEARQSTIENILVLGALGGRFDHSAAAISVLHEHPTLSIFLLSDHSMVTLLPKVRPSPSDRDRLM